ncbi:cation-independent mannose-6-phosphate receptor isoform X2 [Lepeophtheirus salmonis]|uniref:cation-independent mannose-6-phosphate receptor isoform X2 n=1 Tax=Lepeophtheirus salmonis TaxID=72036 RepID=UPI003AF35CDD
MEKFILIVILLSLFKSSFALNICDSIWSRKTKELRQGNLNFYLSPCGNHLENDKIQELCDSDFSACISKFNGSEQIPFIKSLGSPITNTIEEGYSLHFNGPPCSASADASIVAIKFICDIGLYDDKISLLKSPGIDSCVFIFLWLSPSACPKSGTTSVKSFDACESHVQEINHTVNLNNMIRQEETFVIPSTPDRVYRFRLCSTLTSEDGCNGSVFCITSSDGSFISDLGFGTRDHSNWTVTTSYDHWMTNITLEYESIQAKVHFNFICTKGNPYIQLDSETVTSHNKKLIMFNVFTKQACSINVTECPLLSNSANYDLRGLLLKEWNVNNISITLCRPNHNCLHENDNICSTDGKISTKLQNHELIVEGREEFAQKVRLIYNTNNNCNGTNGSISFIYECNKEDLGPTLIEIKNNCHYYFLWRTPFVCVRSLGEEMEVYLHTGVNKCLFGDLGIDLSSLYNEDGDIIIYDSSSNSSWAINICGKGLLGGYNGTCGANSAVCKLDNIPPLEDIMIPSKNSLNGVSVGQNNLINGMQMSQMLTLMYSSEEKCKDDEKQNLTSSFMFICGTKQLFSKPEFFPGNETCSHQFVWTTHLVCPVQSISCDIDGPNDTKINLGVLSGSNIDDDIIVKHDKAVFVLDVCRELQSSKLFYDCPVNSAACMLVSENGTEVSLGLGELRNPPYYNSTSKDIHLDYTMGSICSLDSSNHTHYSTRVIFRCDWGRRIFSMEYLGRLGCQYQFLVLTDAACPRKRTAITKDGCYISGNPNFPNEIIDFSQLSGSNSSLTFKDSDRNTFYINICDYLPGYDPFAAILKKPNGNYEDKN